MKLVKKYILGSVTAFLFINNVMANESSLNNVQISEAIEINLNKAMAEITQPSIESIVEQQLRKSELQLETDQLVARASDTLPVNRFKVVIAD